MTAEHTSTDGAAQPLGLGSSEGLGLDPERALWDAMGCIADDEACLQILREHIAARVAAERERCVKLVPTQHVPEKWHESEAHQQADMSFCAGWNAARKAMLSALNEGPNGPDKLPARQGGSA
jgi:hypothetical protein